MAGILYNRPKYNDFEYNRFGLEEKDLLILIDGILGFYPWQERYYANERYVNFDIESEVKVIDRYISKERLDEIVILLEFLVGVDYSKFIDLLPLVPEKFRSSELLKGYLKDVGLYVGTWAGKINDFTYLVDPYNVDADYVQKLADLLGYELIKSEPTLDDLRNQVAQVIPWYKVKGTYESLKYLAHLMKFTVNIYDMYTKDYSIFIKVPWFVGEENENPPGLDSSYYKSPHFGTEVLLDKVYGSGSDKYLWNETLKEDIVSVVERVRPVNTVPHYIIFLNPKTNETGQVIEVNGEIKTCITLNWETVFLYFDQWWLSGKDDEGLAIYNRFQYNEKRYNQSGLNIGWNFDDGHHFDQINELFLSKVTKWKLGIGNKGVTPSKYFTSLQNPVLSGDITYKRVYSDKIEFEWVVNVDVLQYGISELGLYLDDETTLVLVSTFPDIDKLEDIELRILIQVSK